MQILFWALLTLLPTSSPATTSLCGTQVVCGTFESHDGRKIPLTFSDAGPDKVLITYDINGHHSERNLYIRADGTAHLGEPGEEIGLGVCKDRVCYISQSPLENGGAWLSIFQIFHFSEEAVVFEKLMSRSDGEQKKTVATFYRKH